MDSPAKHRPDHLNSDCLKGEIDFAAVLSPEKMVAAGTEAKSTEQQQKSAESEGTARTAGTRAAAVAMQASVLSWFQALIQHGLSSKKMALITSNDAVMCSLRIKWP